MPPRKGTSVNLAGRYGLLPQTGCDVQVGQAVLRAGTGR
nr:MAG TPA: hypothetical protein [Caudoviricetes sp.]